MGIFLKPPDRLVARNYCLRCSKLAGMYSGRKFGQSDDGDEYILPYRTTLAGRLESIFLSCQFYIGVFFGKALFPTKVGRKGLRSQGGEKGPFFKRSFSPPRTPPLFFQTFFSTFVFAKCKKQKCRLRVL